MLPYSYILYWSTKTERSPGRWELSVCSKRICLQRICEGVTACHRTFLLWHVTWGSIECIRHGQSHPACHGRRANFSARTIPPPSVSDAAKKNAYECSCWGFRTADYVIWANEEMWKWDSCTFRCTFRCTCQSTLLRYVAIISFLSCNAVETSARAWSGSSRCIAWQIASSLVSSQILAICMLIGLNRSWS